VKIKKKIEEGSRLRQKGTMKAAHLACAGGVKLAGLPLVPVRLLEPLLQPLRRPLERAYFCLGIIGVGTFPQTAGQSL